MLQVGDLHIVGGNLRRPCFTRWSAAISRHFFARSRERANGLPFFVERELRAYLDCGILARGFIRVRCDGCRAERLVAFSCKSRSICPSCATRRMKVAS